MGGNNINYKTGIKPKGFKGAIQYHDGAGDLAACNSANIVCNPDGTSIISATLFVGDGGLLSNVNTGTLQQVTDTGNTTSNTVQFTNTHVSFVTSGSVGILQDSPSSVLTVGNSTDQYSNVRIINPTSQIVVGHSERTRFGLETGNNLVLSYGTGGNKKHLGIGTFNDDENMYLGTANVARVTILSTGEVGVDNLEPSNALVIGSPANVWVDTVEHQMVFANNIIIRNYSEIPITTTGEHNIMIGLRTGSPNATRGIHIGYRAGEGCTKSDTIAIGNEAGNNQENYAIAIGNEAGNSGQQSNAIAIGELAGNSNQQLNAVAVGYYAGNDTQQRFATAVGSGAGQQNSQGEFAVAVGYNAGNNNQGSNSVAVGRQCGQTNQGTGAVAIGEQAGVSQQNNYSVAMGYFAGNQGQYPNSIAIGVQAGKDGQRTGTVAVGNLAGFDTQKTNAIAIGNEAGKNGQNNYSIAIGAGAGKEGQHLNTIALNATSSPLNTTETDALFIKPIKYGQDVTSVNEVSNVLSYDPDSGQVIHQYPQSTFLLATKYDSGETINKGDAVYIVEAQNDNVAKVSRAVASDPTKMPCVGIAFENFNGGPHPVVTFGKAKGINTSAFEEGETLYVSNTVVGGLTNVKPIGNIFTANPDLIQNVGFVVKKNSPNGTIKVTGVGRTNDIPNANVLSDDSTVQYVYVNTSGNDLKKIYPAKLVTGPLTLSVSGTSMFPENNVNTTTITGISGTAKYAGGVLAPNGKIYCVPYDASNVLIVDPVTDTADTTTITGITGGDKYIGGVLAPNGKIYCVPYTATNVLIVDPVTDTADTTTITGITGGSKYVGGVLAPNGKIYCVPYTATNVLIIDPVTDTADTTTITGISGSTKYFGGVLAPNGKIYCVPYDASNVLIIDTVTDTADTTTITGISGSIKYSGGVLAPNGKIYCVPRDASNVLIIDPVTDTADTTTITGISGSNKYIGGVLAPNGKIYCAPFDASNVLIVDPVTDTADTTTITGISDSTKYAGGVLAPNGKNYCVPYDASNVAIIKTGVPTEGSWILQPEFNKF